MVIRIALLVSAMMMVFGNLSALASHDGDFPDTIADIVVTVPTHYHSCPVDGSSDSISLTNVGDRYLRGNILVEYVTKSGRLPVPGGHHPVDQTGDLFVTVNYPPVADWPLWDPDDPTNHLREVTVSFAIEVYSEPNGLFLGYIGPEHNWDVFCLDPQVPPPPPPPPPPPTGGEGCTPGYWRQPHHFDSWVTYSPNDSFASVFGVTPTGNGSVLLGDAVESKGGGENALMRHAVAALLSAASPDVSYAFTVAEVIAAVQTAYATGDFETTKDMFEEQNEAGCLLD